MSGNINIRCHGQSSGYSFSCLPVWLLLCTISTLGPMQTMPQTSHFSLPFGSRIPPSPWRSWTFLLSATSLLSIRGSSRLLPSSWPLISSSRLRGFLSHSSSLCISSFTEFAVNEKELKTPVMCYNLHFFPAHCHSMGRYTKSPYCVQCSCKGWAFGEIEDSSGAL